MARYLDASGTRFFELDRTGAVVAMRAGEVGTAGRGGTQAFASPLAARYHVGGITRRELGRGYRLVEEAPALDDLPADVDARLVHADLLLERGDPLGELAVLQHQGADAHVLIEANAATWFGDLADARGQLELVWHLGALQKVEIHPTGALEALMPEVARNYQVMTIVEALFELRIARVLDELVIGVIPDGYYTPVIDAIVERAPPTLRRLEIDADPRRHPDVAHLAPMRFPNLETFACDANLGLVAVHEVATAQWPKLRELSIATYGCRAAELPHGVGEAVDALAPIFERRGTPALTHLAIWTPAPTLVAQAVIPHAASFEEIVIRSVHHIDPAVAAALPPCARFDLQPLYSMRA